MNFTLSSKAVTLKDFDNICRLCLGDQNLSPISNTTIADIKVEELLVYSVTIEIKHDDALPANICEDCITELYKIYEFKQQCLNNEAVLNLLVENKVQEQQEIEAPCNVSLVEEEVEYVSEENNQENQVINEEQPEQRIILVGSHNKPKRGRKKVQCEFCNKIVNSDKIAEHRRIHTKERPFKCDMCIQEFTNRSNLKRHKMIHTGERPYICSKCGKGFIQSTTLHEHEKTHRKEDDYWVEGSRLEGYKYTCEFCGRCFKRIQPFQRHVARHTDVSKFRTIRTESDTPRSYKCEQCPRAYTSKSLLSVHRKTHGEKKFLCSECGKGFFAKANLDSHFKTHTGEKPHKCLICEKSFGHLGSLDSHMLIHLGLKPYHCKFCDKKFTQQTHLNYHTRTHSGERPYICSFCNKSFALKGNLTVHIRTHTGETPYVCSVCGKGFHDSSSMKKHRRKTHSTWNENEEAVQEIEVETCENEITDITEQFPVDVVVGS